ncbi:unnamed protein product [Ostreobium quekettii]|uniref:Zinc finger C2H2 LYAR-type domain-containing protein n=1 Tax=Ostreobium quekettii TaxID=121088 RepID=A0A8S1J4A9_9CHLO|nr:unnamed protein product [Ostreobium quekettii]|eukprot:evm.model.scf_250.4 EVM.evm.TU.scf_250.4   scf_250:51118-54123(-)
MVWFICDSCGDSIKKPKVAKHLGSCAAWSFTCIDCQRTFDRKSVHNHINCVSEKEKYVDGATKPGGFAAKGYADGAVEARAQVQIEGGEYLSQRPPWMCR